MRIKGRITRNKKATANMVNDPMLRVYLAEANATPILTAQEEVELADRIEQGDLDARDHMTRANLKLVVSVALGFHGRGLAIGDLISEGNIGLIRAVEGYDPKLGYRFSTYAAYWIRQSISRAIINQSQMFRIPSTSLAGVSKWNAAKKLLAEDLGRDPSNDEIAGFLNLTPNKTATILQSIRSQKMNRVEPGFDKQGTEETLDDVLAMRPQEDKSDTVAEHEELNAILKRISALDGRAATVIRMRFGLAPYDQPMTLTETGAAMGVSRESIRTIEKQAKEELSLYVESLGYPRPNPREIKKTRLTCPLDDRYLARSPE